MALSREAESRLEGLDDQLKAFQKVSHRDNENDYDKAIGIVIDLYKQGEALEPADVVTWAISRNWSKADAQAIGVDVQAAVATLEIPERR